MRNLCYHKCTISVQIVTIQHNCALGEKSVVGASGLSNDRRKWRIAVTPAIVITF
jgi:hypothetical protein